MPDESAMAEARTCLHLGRQPGCDDCDKFARALQWQTAKRVVSDDHPQECPCIRDHLEVAFLLGMDEATGRAEAPDADEEALWRAIDQWCTEDPPSAVIDLHHAVEALIAYRERRYVEALEQERAQFQRETLRTSELHRMLERAGSYIREVDGPDSPLARAFAREISELLAKPINAAAPASPGGGVMVLRNVGDDLQGARDEALREALTDAKLRLEMAKQFLYEVATDPEAWLDEGIGFVDAALSALAAAPASPEVE